MSPIYVLSIYRKGQIAAMPDIFYDHEVRPQHGWTNPLLWDFCVEDVPKTAIDECVDRLDAEWFKADASKPQVSIAAIENDFMRLAEQWRRETENLSSITRIVSNSAYQKIIQLGKQHRQSAIRLILTDLSKQGGFWAVALNAISGENPVSPDHIGNPSKVREDWLKWGKTHGYVR